MTWTWNTEITAEGKTYHMRFSQKVTSPDSFDFKNEIGAGTESMSVMMEGKETRGAARAPSTEQHQH